MQNLSVKLLQADAKNWWILILDILVILKLTVTSFVDNDLSQEFH